GQLHALYIGHVDAAARAADADAEALRFPGSSGAGRPVRPACRSQGSARRSGAAVPVCTRRGVIALPHGRTRQYNAVASVRPSVCLFVCLSVLGLPTTRQTDLPASRVTTRAESVAMLTPAPRSPELVLRVLRAAGGRFVATNSLGGRALVTLNERAVAPA